MRQTLPFYLMILKRSKMCFISSIKGMKMNMKLGEEDGLLTMLGSCMEEDLDLTKQEKLGSEMLK